MSHIGLRNSYTPSTEKPRTIDNSSFVDHNQLTCTVHSIPKVITNFSDVKFGEKLHGSSFVHKSWTLQYSSNFTRGSSRHVSTRLDTFDVSSASRRAVRQARQAKMRGLDTSNVSCRDVTWRAKWNMGLSGTKPYVSTNRRVQKCRY